MRIRALPSFVEKDRRAWIRKNDGRIKYQRMWEDNQLSSVPHPFQRACTTTLLEMPSSRFMLTSSTIILEKACFLPTRQQEKETERKLNGNLGG